MRAARLMRFGGPEAIDVLELEDPTPQAGEVLVRVARCGLNRADVNFSRGEYGGIRYGRMRERSAGLSPSSGPNFPLAIGIEPAGTVSAVGAGVPSEWCGRRVLVVPRFGCGHCTQCRRGDDHLCALMRTLGTSTPGRGGLDELLCVPTSHVIELPPSLSTDAGAAIAADVAPAWWIVQELAGLRAGMTVAVKGASGNVGLAVLSIARLLGARAIAVTRTADKRASLEDAGADCVVVADPSDAAAAIREASDGGADVVVEPFGGDSFGDSLQAIRKGGAVAIVGSFVGASATLDLTLVFHQSARIVGGSHCPMRVVHHVVALMGAGRLRPNVAAVVPLKDVQAAYRLQEGSSLVGKVVVDLD